MLHLLRGDNGSIGSSKAYQTLAVILATPATATSTDAGDGAYATDNTRPHYRRPSNDAQKTSNNAGRNLVRGDTAAGKQETREEGEMGTKADGDRDSQDDVGLGNRREVRKMREEERVVKGGMGGGGAREGVRGAANGV